MRILVQPEELRAGARPVAVAIGVFDGVHLGHQEVIRRTLARAASVQGVALVTTFDRHPNAVVAPERTPPAIQSLGQRLRAIERLGVEAVWLIRFDRAFSELTGEQFVRRLITGLGVVRAILVGQTFHFGHRRSGDVALLRRLGAELGFATEAVEPVVADGEPISSTRIRERIRAGDLAGVSRLLGRDYALAGKVVPGDQLGRQLSFPTANLDVAGLVLPPHGVYAARVEWNGRPWPGVMNIGVRPTLDGDPGSVRVEVHLLDADVALYGEELEVTPVSRLRDEARFPSLEALRAQITRDVERVRAILGA